MSDYYPPGITSTPYDEERPMTARPDALALLASLARHADDCLHASPLPTGEGFWHCTCGYDSIILDGKLVAALEASPGCVVDAGLILVEEASCVPHVHPEYGMGLFFTEDAKLAAAPKASAPVEGTQACRDGIGFDCGLPFAHDGHCIATPQADPAPPVAGGALAARFHEAYERLAPSFGYETRHDTRAFDPASPNGRLMAAVCGELLADHARMVAAQAAEIARMTTLRDGWALAAHTVRELKEAADQRAEAMAGLSAKWREEAGEDCRVSELADYWLARRQCALELDEASALLRDGLAGQEGDHG